MNARRPQSPAFLLVFLLLTTVAAAQPAPPATQPAPPATQPASPAAPTVAAPPAAEPAAPPPPVAITTRSEPEVVKLGDRFTLVVTARHAADVRLFFPAAPSLGAYRLLTPAGAPERVQEGDSVVETWRLELMALRIGKRKIPSFPIDYETLAKDTGHVSAPPTTVVTEGRIEDASKEVALSPAAPPFQVFDRNWALIIALISVGVITVTAVLTLVAARYVARLAPRGPPPPLPRPAHEVAAEKIAALRDSGLLAKGQLKEFVFRASEILRDYVGRRYKVDALERTSSELLADMKTLSPKGLSLYEFEAFLSSTDLVKFAGITPAHDECSASLQTVETMVLATRASDLEVAGQRATEELRRRLEKPAHPFKRVFAVSVDLLILATISTGLILLGRKLGFEAMPWVSLGLTLTLFLLRDLFGEGSPGKVLSGLGLAPMHDTRSEALDGGARIARNLPHLLPIAGHTMELVVMVYASDGRRVGDRMAGTRVLDRRPDASEYSFLLLAIVAVSAAVIVGGVLPFIWMGAA